MPEPISGMSANSNGSDASKSAYNGRRNALSDFVHPMGIEAVMMAPHVHACMLDLEMPQAIII